MATAARGLVFGEKLEDTLARDQLPLPQFVVAAIVYLSEHGIHGKESEGLFRLQAAEADIEAFTSIVKGGGKLTLKPGTSVHAVAVALKRYLVQLPEPLIPDHLYPLFEDLVEDVQSVSDAVSLARMLSDDRRRLLLYLLLFLHYVAVESRTGSKMTSFNLATVFGPNVIRRTRHTPEQELAANANVVSSMQYLIDNVFELFHAFAPVGIETLCPDVFFDSDTTVPAAERPHGGVVSSGGGEVDHSTALALLESDDEGHRDKLLLSHSSSTEDMVPRRGGSVAPPAGSSSGTQAGGNPEAAAELAALRTNVAKLQRQLKSAESEVAVLKADGATERERILQNAKARESELSDKLAELRLTLDSSQTAEQKHLDTIRMFQGEIRSLTAERDGLSAAANLGSGAGAREAALVSELERVKRDAEAAKTAAAAATVAAAGADEAKAQVASLLAENARKGEEARAATTAAAAAERSRAAAVSESNRLQAVVDDAAATAAAAQEKDVALAAERGKVAKLERQLAAAEAATAAAEARHAQSMRIEQENAKAREAILAAKLGSAPGAGGAAADARGSGADAVVWGDVVEAAKMDANAVRGELRSREAELAEARAEAARARADAAAAAEASEAAEDAAVAARAEAATARAGEKAANGKIADAMRTADALVAAAKEQAVADATAASLQAAQARITTLERQLREAVHRLSDPAFLCEYARIRMDLDASFESLDKSSKRSRSPTPMGAALGEAKVALDAVESRARARAAERGRREAAGSEQQQGQRSPSPDLVLRAYREGRAGY